MPLTLDDFNGMELLWNQLPKRPDLDHVTLSTIDIDGMWHAGMVDTKRFPIETWRAAFDSHKRPDGTFLLSKEEFLEKEAYRYKGEIMIPFDAMQINEGKYTEEALKELFELSIIPSCSLEPASINAFIEEIRSKHREPSGMIKMDRHAKLAIRDLVEKNPSPLRRLELMFDAIIKGVEEKGIEALNYDETSAASGSTQLSQEQLAKVQVSSYAARAATVTEERFHKLKSLEKKKKKEEPAEEGTRTALKKVARSRKGIRG